MSKLLKTLNKFNGNICFKGSTDSGDYVFESDYFSHVLSYALSSKLITDVCLETEYSYLVAFSDQYLGRYTGGTLDETYVDTGLGNIDKIVGNTSSQYYLLSRPANQLFKGSVSGTTWTTIWTLDLPDYSLRNDGNIILRESDNTIIYHNDSNVYVIRDDVTGAMVINSLSVPGSGDLSLVIGNEFNSEYTYMRARSVSGKELWQSSSSSLTSLEYSSSTSSSMSSLSSSSSTSSSSSESSSSSTSSSTEIRSSSSSSSTSSSTEIRSSSSSSSLLNRCCDLNTYFPMKTWYDYYYGVTLTIGPFAYDYEIYTDTTVNVDDDFEIDGVRYQPGPHGAIIIPSGTVLASKDAGEVCNITVVNLVIYMCGASGWICWRPTDRSSSSSP